MAKLFPLLAGLIIFLGTHIVTRMPRLREALIRASGPLQYRGLYSLVSLMGFALIVHGFSSYRMAGYIQVWDPPRFLNHLAILLIWPAMILLVAAYAPGTIKARAKHPMLAAIKIWALAHLLVNGDLGSMLLFGSFLGYAVFARIALKRAGLGAGSPEAANHPNARRNDAIAVVLGTLVTLALVLGLHKMLIGVAIS